MVSIPPIKMVMTWGPLGDGAFMALFKHINHEPFTTIVSGIPVGLLTIVIAL